MTGPRRKTGGPRGMKGKWVVREASKQNTRVYIFGVCQNKRRGPRESSFPSKPITVVPLFLFSPFFSRFFPVTLTDRGQLERPETLQLFRYSVSRPEFVESQRLPLLGKIIWSGCRGISSPALETPIINTRVERKVSSRIGKLMGEERA